MRIRTTLAAAALALALPRHGVPAQTPKLPVHGQKVPRLAIRNATIVDGNGTPARGPADILVENGRIADIVFLDPVSVKAGRVRRLAADAEIDATGKYVLPGLINAHGHLQNERAHVPQPLDYNLKLWLACGITTVREVGSDSTSLVLRTRDASARGEIVAPRLLAYARFTGSGPTPRTPAEARARNERDIVIPPGRHL